MDDFKYVHGIDVLDKHPFRPGKAHVAVKIII